jgi:hypothetical protein
MSVEAFYDPAGAHKPAADTSLMSKIEPPKVLDLIISKQTQYYTLWGVYTAVQFAAASFGLSQHALPLGVVLAVLLGFWAFNIGHLGFVLECLAQLNRLKSALNAVLHENRQEYEKEIRLAFSSMGVARVFWRLTSEAGNRRSYIQNIAVHFFIDTCASVALLSRADSPWLQNHIPSFLRATT